MGTSSGESLEALLHRLGIPPSRAPAGTTSVPFAYKTTPRLDALTNSQSTPQRPTASAVATPLSRTAGGRVLPKPSPSVLDKLMADSPRRVALGTSSLGVGGAAELPGSASLGLSSQGGKADLYTSYLQARVGDALSSKPSASGGATPGGRSSGSCSPFAWQGTADLQPKRGSGGDFSIAALRPSPATALGRATEPSEPSLELRITSLLGSRAAELGSARLGSVGGGRPIDEQPQHQAGTPAGAGRLASASPPLGWQPSQGGIDGTAQSGGSRTPGGNEALLQQQDIDGPQRVPPQPVSQQTAGVPNAECSILESRVRELQAQLRLKDIEHQRTVSMAVELRKERDTLQERLEQTNGEVDRLQQRCQQAEMQRLEQEQAAAEQRETLRGREAAHHASAAALSRAHEELEAERSGAEGLREQIRMMETAAEQNRQEALQLRAAMQDANRASAGSTASLQQRLSDLSAENQQLQSQYSLSQVEVLALQRQAEGAEARCRHAEARCRQLESELQSAEHGGLDKDSRLEDAAQQVSALQQRVRSLTDQLSLATEQYERAQQALQQERQANQHQRVHATASQQSEAALTSQMKSMAAQIQGLQREAADLKAANADLRSQLVTEKSSMQDELSSLEQHATRLQEERDQLHGTANRALRDLEAKVQQVEQQRREAKQLQADNRALQEALRQHQAEVAMQSQQAAALQGQVEALEVEAAQLQQQLRESKQRCAELEASLAKSAASQGPQSSSLRDVVGSVRSELAEKDLQLVAAAEEVAAERGHVQELQRQVLDQAMELEELQQQQSEAFSLRQQLAAARQSEAQLKKRAGELAQLLSALQQQQQQGGTGGGGGSVSQSGAASPAHSTGSSRAVRVPQQAAAAGSPGRSAGGAAQHPADNSRQGDAGPSGLEALDSARLRQKLARLEAERDQLAAQCEARDAEVMQLQGQVRILQSQADAESWLMGP
ncbi:hypothetical protein N2152v2_005466 [Parachlorella kessleri]